MEQRTLVAAYKFYCGKELDEAHSAEADTLATYEVLLAQLDRYPELKNEVDYLAASAPTTRAESSSTRKGSKCSASASTRDAR